MFQLVDEQQTLENDSVASDDLSIPAQRKLSGTVRCVFVDCGMRSLMFRQDVDESFLMVKRAVEGKIGVPVDEQILSLSQNTSIEIDNDKSLRNYGYLGGAFCKLTNKA